MIFLVEKVVLGQIYILEIWFSLVITIPKILHIHLNLGDGGGTVVKVLCYKSEGRWFDPSWCQKIFH